MGSLIGLVASIPPKIRAGIFAAGAVLWVVGLMAVLWNVETSIFLFLVAMGVMHLSDLGRPVVINMFTETDQQEPTSTVTLTDTAGYL